MRDITSCVVHYSSSPDVSAETIRQWHIARGYKTIGYHTVIRKDGKVEPGRPEKEVGAHTLGFNANSLGVCLTGSDQMEWYPSPFQMASLQAVLRDWMKRYDIPAANIFFHREKNATSCPGRLDKAKVMALLGAKPTIEEVEEDMPDIKEKTGRAMRFSGYNGEIELTDHAGQKRKKVGVCFLKVATDYGVTGTVHVEVIPRDKSVAVIKSDIPVKNRRMKSVHLGAGVPGDFLIEVTSDVEITAIRDQWFN